MIVAGTTTSENFIESTQIGCTTQEIPYVMKINENSDVQWLRVLKDDITGAMLYDDVMFL
jgi:hypothetical protein